MSDTKKPETVFMGGQPYDHNDLGLCIHTALRKCCDSPITSLAYCLISGLDGEWDLFLQRLHIAIGRSNRAHQSPKEMVAFLRDLVGVATVERQTRRSTDWIGEPLRTAESVRTARPSWQLWEDAKLNRSLYQALITTFALFTERDWEGLVTFLFDAKPAPEPSEDRV